ncbi:hypothetical protein MVEN_00033700 [Mycena venus]|uniref:Uncharacterized protein n=1 Tax=Mycena venus TaxID=2733690 RepID=A0A8H7DHP5_9AGAR|nr:hypothetical protein MVEN_00033700 [Mycena venus]
MTGVPLGCHKSLVTRLAEEVNEEEEESEGEGSRAAGNSEDSGEDIDWPPSPGIPPVNPEVGPEKKESANIPPLVTRSRAKSASSTAGSNNPMLSTSQSSQPNNTLNTSGYKGAKGIKSSATGIGITSCTQIRCG